MWRKAKLKDCWISLATLLEIAEFWKQLLPLFPLAQPYDNHGDDNEKYNTPNNACDDVHRFRLSFLCR